MTHAEVFGLDAPVATEDLAEFNQRELADPLSAFDRIWLAWDGPEMAGSVALRRFDDTSAELKRLYVREPYRREGLAQRLIHTVVDEARRQGYQRILVDTLPGRSAAIALFTACGFAPTKPFHDYPIPSLFFALDLPESG